MQARAFVVAAVLTVALSGSAFSGSKSHDANSIFGGPPFYGGSNADISDRASDACRKEAAEHDYTVEGFGQQQRVGDKRYAIAMELQRDRRIYTATCIFDAEERYAKLSNVEEARSFGGGQFANYDDPRRVCANSAERRGWTVERVGNVEEIGQSRYLVRLRVRTAGHNNNSAPIDCMWDARRDRVEFNPA